MNEYVEAFITIKNALNFAFNNEGEKPHPHDIYCSMGLLKGAVLRTIRMPYQVDVDGKAYCGECGVEIKDDEYYCSRCGHPIDWGDEDE